MGEEMSKQVWSIIGGVALVVSISAILWFSKVWKLDTLAACNHSAVSGFYCVLDTFRSENEKELIPSLKQRQAEREALRNVAGDESLAYQAKPKPG